MRRLERGKKLVKTILLKTSSAVFGDPARKVDLNCVAHAAGYLLLPGLRGEEGCVFLVGQKARLEEYGRGIRRLQHDERSKAMRVVAERHFIGGLPMEQAREVGRDTHCLALGQVEQDRRDRAPMHAEVDSVYDVRLVFARRQLRRLAV